MLLSEKLAQIREKAAQAIPADKQVIMHRATEDLGNSGIVDSVIAVGQKLPAFTLLNQSGIPTSSSILHDSGPMVLTVFRGSW